MTCLGVLHILRVRNKDIYNSLRQPVGYAYSTSYKCKTESRWQGLLGKHEESMRYRKSSNVSSGQRSEKKHHIRGKWLATWTWRINRRTWQTNRSRQTPFHFGKCKWPSLIFLSCRYIRGSEPSEIPLKMLRSRSSSVQLTLPGGFQPRHQEGCQEDEANATCSYILVAIALRP